MKDCILEHYIFERYGCPIHYWLGGDEQRPLVTFIHGAGADHHIFDPQIAAVAAFFRILLWDMRGQGRSQPARTAFSISDCVEDLVALLDHLEYNQTSLVGISFGGTIAQEVVLCFPERVASLVIVGTACNTLPLTPLTRLMLQIFMLFIRFAPIKVLRLALSFFASLNQHVRSYVYQAFLQVSGQNHRQIWETFNEIFSRSPTPFNYHITHPLLLLRGQYDNLWNQKLMAIWAKYEPDHRYIVIPDAGHLANWDEASEFNRILVDFLLVYGDQGPVKICELQEEKHIHG